MNNQDKALHRCEECGFQYAEKEWAAQCEAWCREHKSCNIEVTAHGMPPEDHDNQFLNKLFYGLVGLSASLAFFLALYWSLRLNANIDNLIRNFIGIPLYFWPYVVLTIGAIILFGINVTLFIYRWRKWGPPQMKGQAGSGLGSFIGMAASACPVCGSTILSAVGIAGGLAAFPLGGLELKALSVGLLALPIWLMQKDLKKMDSDCEKRICPAPRDPSFKDSDSARLWGFLVLVALLLNLTWTMLKTDPALARLLPSNILNLEDNVLYSASVSETGKTLFDEVIVKVLPERGFQSKIRLGDSVVKLVGNGVIDQAKLEAIYQERGGFPAALKDVLTKSSDRPILLTKENANYYVNLLWPLGLSNYMSSNTESPIQGKSLFNFASTGGWSLGKEENGGAYFNTLKIVELTPEQEALVAKIAQNTYRPCCNNSTFYQDCNHGSALLGLLQLGASQGLNENELYQEALAFNSFWFPNNYIQTALYFKAVENTDWEDVSAKEVMGKNFSTISGWSTTVAQKVKELGLLPQQKGGAGCGV